MALSFHPLGIHFLAWFSLVPLLFAIDGKNRKFTFKSGIIFGFLFSLMSLFWLVFLQIDTNVKILMLFGLLLLFLYIGLYFGVCLLIAKSIGIWFLPLAIVGLEFIRGLGELGFPWLSFGYSQARYPIIIQQASIYGIYGISFWLVLLNVSLYKLIKECCRKYIILTALIFVLPLTYGLLRLKQPAGKFITIGIVQPNIDPNLKFTKGMREVTFDRLINLSFRCAELAQERFNTNIKLIVWPETAIPLFLKTPSKYQDLIFDLSREINVPIFTGTPIFDSKTHEVYNGAILIEPGKAIEQEYRKIHLVPFGEHIPFDRYIPAFRNIDLGEGDYASGKKYMVFTTGEIKFSCLICFESIFPELSLHSYLLSLQVKCLYMSIRFAPEDLQEYPFSLSIRLLHDCLIQGP